LTFSNHKKEAIGALNRYVVRNTCSTIIQVICTGLVLFFLYRFLMAEMGIERLGIWSIVVALSILGRVGDIGISGSLVKYVAKYQSLNDMPKSASIIQTAILSTCLGSGITCILCYPILTLSIEQAIPEIRHEALAILPHALLAAWLASISATVNSALDGCNRIDLRNISVIISSVFFWGFALMLVPSGLLLGLAIARIVQMLCALGISWSYLRRQIAQLPLLPNRWSRESLLLILPYSVKYQYISILSLLTDPLFKGLLGYFGSLADVGFYEMAYQVATRVRVLISAASQVVVPIVAKVYELNVAIMNELYSKVYQNVFFFSLSLSGGVVAISAALSILWIGHIEYQFVLFMLILVLQYTIAMVAGTAYHFYMGFGRLKYNIIGHLAITVGGVLFASIGGHFIGASGVVMGSLFAAIIGHATILINFHKENLIPLKKLIPKDSMALSITFVLLFVVSCGNLLFDLKTPLKETICIIVYVFIALPVIWVHPMRLQTCKLIADVFSVFHSKIN
jgi:O-antigen/teichoic acid export membrane protein